MGGVIWRWKRNKRHAADAYTAVYKYIGSGAAAIQNIMQHAE